MKGSCHWAGWEPAANADCGVLEFDKTQQCLSDSPLTAPHLRPDHVQSPLQLPWLVSRVFPLFLPLRQPQAVIMSNVQTVTQSSLCPSFHYLPFTPALAHVSVDPITTMIMSLP